MHPWHDVSPGKELPRDFQALIEIPLGSNVKYELDKATVCFASIASSTPRSFIPRTTALSRKPTRKIMILSTFSSFARNLSNPSPSSRRAPLAS